VQIYDMESSYFNAEHAQTGNVLKGFEGLLSTKEALRKRQSRGYKPEDRLFSLSSKTSPLVSVALCVLFC
jgi:chromatin modification-related protein EAF6